MTKPAGKRAFAFTSNQSSKLFFTTVQPLISV